MEETQHIDNLLERESEIFNSKAEQMDIWLTGIPLFKNGDVNDYCLHSAEMEYAAVPCAAQMPLSSTASSSFPSQIIS